MARATSRPKRMDHAFERSVTVGRLASLTGHLTAQWSPIRKFLLDHVSSTLPALVRAQLKGVEPLTEPGMESWEHGLVGTALDYRIRYGFDVTPAEQLVAGKAARKLLGAVLVNGRLVPGALGTNVVLDIQALRDAGMEIAEVPVPLLHAVQEFMAGLDSALNALNPVKRCLDDESEELLARHCFVLANLDAILRVAVLPRPFIEPTVCATSADLLASARPAWLRDMRALTAKFLDTITSDGFLELPAVLNPTFVGSADMAADADLIVDACLVEVKCTVDPGRSLIQTLAQLLGYVLLDYEDQYKIDSAAIYFARQGRLLRWSLAELMGCGVTQNGLRALRAEFRELLREPGSKTRSGWAKPSSTSQA